MINIEWNQILPIIGVATVLLAGVILYVRSKLDGVFAKTSDVASLRGEMEGRMEEMKGQIEEARGQIAGVEKRLANMPDHADVRALDQRVAGVERGVAVVDAKLTGVVQGVGRVEHMVDLLVKHQMEGEK